MFQRLKLVIVLRKLHGQLVFAGGACKSAWRSLRGQYFAGYPDQCVFPLAGVAL